MSEKRWTEEQTVQFVERYKQLETLWNVKSGLYKNKHARESALKELVKFMNIDGFGIEEAKNKIRSLRATYIGERNKIDRSVSNGAEEVYKPNMKWFYILEPIMGLSVKRKSFSTVGEVNLFLKKCIWYYVFRIPLLFLFYIELWIVERFISIMSVTNEGTYSCFSFGK